MMSLIHFHWTISKTNAMRNLLKIHLFLFYASISCILVFTTVYIRTYTDASYNAIGLLMMACSLSGAFTKPILCSVSDRYKSYKSCLQLSLCVMALCMVPFIVIPLWPELIFERPNPRFNWYLIACNHLTYSVAVGTAITMDDVFITSTCQGSGGSEDFGQYRCMGSIGWAFSSLCLAFVESYAKLSMVLPPMLGLAILCLDLVIVHYIKNLAQSNSLAALGPAASYESLRTYANASPSSTISGPSVVLVPSLGPVQLTRVRRLSSLRAGSLAFISCPQQLAETEPRRAPAHSSKRICMRQQLELLSRLNGYDNCNLVKYLAWLVVLGASAQVHYIFFLESLSQVLKQRHQFSLIFSVTAVIQISTGLGETFSLLWLSRFLIKLCGRDAVFLVCMLLSALRYAINGFLMGSLSAWLVAWLDIFTGLLWGLIYNMMVDSAASYLALLDSLLLLDSEEADASTDAQASPFLAYLDHLRSTYSIETIRFALMATIQSLFSGACEGLGFALGPLLAGVWLSYTGSTLLQLYQTLVGAHVLLFGSMLTLEYIVNRLVLGARSKTDRFRSLSPT